jgi:phage head maturation protease
MYRGGEAMGVTKVLRNVSEGLYFEARASEVPAGDHALTLANDKVLDQVSIGFRARPDGDEFKVENGLELKNWVIRTKVDLFEIALVPEGAYGEGATVQGLRDGQHSRPAPATNRERQLRDALAELGYTSDEIERLAAALPAPQVRDDSELLARFAGLPASL